MRIEVKRQYLMKADKKGALTCSFNEDYQKVVFTEDEICEVLESGN